MRYYLALLAVFSLILQVNAWGSETHKLICSEVSINAWGSDTTTCLGEFADGYCDIIAATFDEDAGTRCRENKQVGILGITDTLFDNIENHKDYTRCPIWKWNAHRNWVCKSLTDPSNPSKEVYDQLFEEAGKNTGCLRVQLFCTAAQYFADSQYPLYQVDPEYHKGCSGKDLMDEVDEVLLRREDYWNASKFCSFTHWKQRTGRKIREDSKIIFKVDKDDIDTIIDELITKASDLKDNTIKQTTSTTILSKPVVAKDVETTPKEPVVLEDEYDKPREVEEQARPPRIEDLWTENPREDIDTPVDKEKIKKMNENEEDIIVKDFIKVVDFLDKDYNKKEIKEGKTGLLIFMILLVLSCITFVAFLAIKTNLKNKKNKPSS